MSHNGAAQAHKLIADAQSECRCMLNYKEVFQLLAAYGIPGVPCDLADNADQAVKMAAKIGFPVALKVASEEFSHKSDVGGVILNLKSAAEVAGAYQKIADNLSGHRKKADVLKVAVQTMALAGTEIIIGMKRDPQFGPVIMFGMGGVLAELLNDISFRIAPVSRGDVMEMITEIKGFQLISGYRGAQAGDIDSLVECILQFSRLSMEVDAITGIDLNPVMLYPAGKGISVVDARIMFDNAIQ